MPIAHNATTTGSSGFPKTITIAHTPAGANRIMLVSTFTASASTVSSVVFNGSENAVLTLATVASGYRVETWLLVAPTATTANLVVTMTGFGWKMAIVSTYTGVHQSSPNVGILGNTGSGSPSRALMPTPNGDYGKLSLCAHGAAHTSSLSPDPQSGQTVRGSLTMSIGGGKQGLLLHDDRAFDISVQDHALAGGDWIAHWIWLAPIASEKYFRASVEAGLTLSATPGFAKEQRLYVGEGGRFGGTPTVIFADVDSLDLDSVTLAADTWYEALVLPGQDAIEGNHLTARARFRTDGAGTPIVTPNLVSRIVLTPQAGGDTLVSWEYDPQYQLGAPVSFKLRWDFDQDGLFDFDQAADASVAYTAGQRRYSSTIAAVGTPNRLRVNIRAQASNGYDNADRRVWHAPVATAGPAVLDASVVLATATG